MSINQYNSRRSDITFDHAHLMLCYECEPVSTSELNSFHDHLHKALKRYLHEEEFELFLRGDNSIEFVSINIVAYERLDELMEDLRIELELAMLEWHQYLPH
jgi:hypothetical protein